MAASLHSEDAFILGEDGKVHVGEVARRMGGTIMLTDCRVLGLRPMGPGETWWHDDDHRICGECMQEVDDG